MKLRDAESTDLYRFHLIERTPTDDSAPWIEEVETFFNRDAGFWLRGDAHGTDRHLLVVEDDTGEMAGAVAWEAAHDTVYITGVLLEYHRRGGFGALLFDRVLDNIAASAPGLTVWWRVDHRNVAMVKLSERATSGTGHPENKSRYLRFELVP